MISRGGQLLAFWAVALAGAGARAEQQIAFPQGGEQPLAALQDIDVIEHLGEHIPSGLTFTNVAGQPVALDALLESGYAGGRHARLSPLPDVVRSGARRVGQGRTHGAGLGAGQGLHGGRHQHRSRRRHQAAPQGTEHRRAGAGGQAAGETAAEVWPFWLSTTDGAAAARTLADAVGFRYKFNPHSKQFAHEAVAFVLTPEGVISRYLYGVDYAARDFRMAVVEASGGRVGTSLNKVILSCYRYDPTGRRYGPFVLGFMRIGALLVFFALVGLLAVLWRKEIAMRKRLPPPRPREDGMTPLRQSHAAVALAAGCRSTFAVPVDRLHFFVITVTMIASTITGLMAFFFFFKYRERRPKQSTPVVVPSMRFEFVVIGVPLFFFLLWFVQGFNNYVWYTTPPKNATDVYVMAKKWMWKFSYGGDGPNAIGTLHVPANRPVRLLITSRDVIHLFFVPDFRISRTSSRGVTPRPGSRRVKPGRSSPLLGVLGTWHSQMWAEDRGHGRGPSSTSG